VFLVSDTVLFQVDKGPPTFRPIRDAKGPEYPPDLRRDRVNGTVDVSFTVDTLGNVVDGSVVIESETDRAFGDAVCAYIRRTRFTPFVVNGRRYSVRVLSQPFTFRTFQ
jgi:TonB family protein